MKKFLLLFLFWILGLGLGRCQDTEKEIPNFSILGDFGIGQCSGYLGSSPSPAPMAGLWLGIGLSNRFDGFWGMNYFSLPSLIMIVPLTPSSSNPATSMTIEPSDDLSFTVNIRWYWSDKYDIVRQRFNPAPYFLGGFGMDMVVDQYPRPLSSNLFGLSFDALFSMNLGVGMDFPIGDQKAWFIYTEALDHLIAWNGLTQFYCVQLGVKVMLDSAHIDPFRGLF